MNLLNLAWALWIVGTALVILSWMNVVSVQIGWGGFAIGTVGFILSRIPIAHGQDDGPVSPADRTQH